MDETAQLIKKARDGDAGHGKPGVVYACGATVQDGKLFVYYGGADKVVCVATTNLDDFLDAIIKGSQPVLEEGIEAQTN